MKNVVFVVFLMLSSAFSMQLHPLTFVQKICDDSVHNQVIYPMWNMVPLSADIMEKAINGDSFSQFIIGLTYYNGNTFIPKNYEAAEEWLHKSAMQGCVRAEYTLGIMYLKGHGVPQNYSLGLQLIMMTAQKGLPEAFFSLGSIYYCGKYGTQKNCYLASKYFMGAALHGYTSCFEILGIMYFYGDGIPQNHVEAEICFSRAATNGFLISKYFLGTIYYNKEMYTDAINMFLESAIQGDVNSMYRLGVIYLFGAGHILPDYSLAMFFFMSAMTSFIAHIPSIGAIGAMYGCGKGVECNHELAFNFYSVAAFCGDLPSMHNLGCMYFLGRHVKKDINRAKYWFQKAICGNFKPSLDLLNSIGI
ncbi:MAG: sel1 repeat family protein [Holosporaceae bacterium]|jgi:TPR repeat protein|nr:sel1 repeat family protein [Holosporaceae bacterium]